MDDNLFGSSGVISPDTILPSQYYDKDKATRTPIGRLMIAVLEDALRWLQRRPDSAGGIEARLWVDEPQDGPFTFDGVCDYLGIEPEYLRKGLKAWDGTRLEKRSGVRYNVAPTLPRYRGHRSRRRV